MRVSDSHQVLFVHVPKTAGSSIDVIFDKEVADARKAAGARHATYERLLRREEQFTDYWSFGFVRNPWARMVSWWSMIAMVFERADAGHQPAIDRIAKDPTAWLPEGEFRHDFDRFVLEGTEKISKVGRPQIKTLSAGARLVDFIGRTENFEKDINIVRERLGLHPVQKVPKRNRSPHAHYTEYYNDVTRRKVAEVYAADIEAFGYTFEEG
ncbi:sulfotransferase family 2 domain-containing protein [Nocardioides terrisoli]|uniref:sulfotransferase family 2 domain-containing protein n=1 Tax=Nocardioides terrisoli TaxID=3388267 RepID=UPI00287BB63B|nr:sulfotransferase family 2 domain-containing protein [Nocardioides marmorisolisilvae]